MKYNVDWLISEYQQEKPIEFLFFWGHQPAKDGSITKSCLSQWWQSTFVADNVVYPSAEHWMMAEKARLFKDKITLKEILKSNTPEEAKAWGRKIKDFDAVRWDAHKYEAVKKGNFYKFSQNPRLKAFLLESDPKILVEASPYDKIWGIHLGEKHPDATNPTLWRGENLLGFALMEVRDLLKAGKIRL